ncbi:MAG: RDD family protein [Polyangiaceae bacterium]|nr:RDD family protein [Myxococcales bacterium]MCB9585647.1 RDD family protein [Polyangiaceae bacterium]
MSEANSKLADRDQRLMAAITDGLLLMVTSAAGLAIASRFMDLDIADPDAGLRFQIVALVSSLPMSAIQWYLVATSGQTIGKKMQRIQVVRMDGKPVGFVHGVALRSWVLGAVGILVGCIRMIDYLYIFREDRRCIHDLIADTKVIALPPLETQADPARPS